MGHWRDPAEWLEAVCMRARAQKWRVITRENIVRMTPCLTRINDVIGALSVGTIFLCRARRKSCQPIELSMLHE